jgi:hypothetical protein
MRDARTAAMETPRPEQPRRSIEYFGVAQSGYTAGRNENDPSLRFLDRNLSYPTPDGEPVPEFADDERFAGRGGWRWAPDR